MHDPTGLNRCKNTNETEEPHCYCEKQKINKCQNKCDRYVNGKNNNKFPIKYIHMDTTILTYYCNKSEYFKQMDFKNFEMGNLLYINHISFNCEYIKDNIFFF